MKILILGGYGVFGGRLAQLLADRADLQLVIAGRDLAKADRFCQDWRGVAQVSPLLADRNVLAPVLAQVRPDLLVDASGPFQGYGPDPYAALRAAIAAGVNYLDLADGADFVAGVASFDAAAKAAGVYVLSGVSSFPVLTAAVLAEIARTMTITDVIGGIAPSPFAGVGMNVMRAVLSYAGSDVAVVRNGAPAKAVGLGESLAYTICPPGKLPLPNLRFSLVDVPDLRLIPQQMPGIKSLWMGAGPLPESLHRLLNLLARARHRFGLPSLAPLAPLCHAVLNALRFGEHRGGMFVEARGLRDGKPVTRSWHLLAEGDDGPFIPSMAIEAIVRKLLSGQDTDPGARAAVGALTLQDYETLFAPRQLYWGWRDSGDAGASLYASVLGTAFADLPPRLQQLHQPGALSRWTGRAEVVRGKGPLVRIVARLFGFPAAGGDLPVTVTFKTDAQGRETWARTFAGRAMTSTQQAGRGRNRHLVVERFGPFAFGLAIVTEPDRLRIIPRRWSVFGLPLPRALMPGGESFETEIDGQFRFHVEITLPLIGRVVRYQGWLQPA